MTTRDRLPRLAAALADVLPGADAEALARVMDAFLLASRVPAEIRAAVEADLAAAPSPTARPV